MNWAFDRKKHLAASSYIRLLVFLLTSALAFSLLYHLGIGATVLTITDQSTGKEYYSISVKPSDTITYGWIHSFEHIPWTEHYIILDSNKLLLKKITVAGFGAGIPHNIGKEFKNENGVIVMSEIDNEFDTINWIHSQTATDYIMLNDKVILRGEDLPHHKALNLRIEKRLKLWPKLKLKTN